MKTSRITLQIVVSTVLFGFILCASIVFAGYREFASNYEKKYFERLEAVSETALHVINPERVEFYKSAETDGTYREIQVILNDLIENFGLNFIYVSQVSGNDYSHITYIFDEVKKDSGWEAYKKGYEEDYFEPSYNKSAKTVYEEGISVVRKTMKSRSGSHITYMLPVKNAEQKVIAVLGVEIDSQEYIDDLHRYLAVSYTIAIILAVLVTAILIFFTNRRVISPLLKISSETDRFKKSGKENPDWKNTIKNKDEIGNLASSISEMEHEIVESVKNLTKVTAEKERISTELDVARNIQASMLPAVYPAFPERKDFDLFASMIPAKEVGGDLYDYLLLDKDHLLLVVGDVSGKGIPASLFMVITKTLIQTRAVEGCSPAEIAEKVNYQLCQNNRLSMFVTCWLGILNLKTGELKFVNAAHPFPVLYHDGKAEFLKTKPELMLGGMDFTKYKEQTAVIKPGDRLFIYTDGVTEAKGSSSELFGNERTLKAFENAISVSKNSKEIISEMKKSIDGFVKDAEQFDDITMMEFEFKKTE